MLPGATTPLQVETHLYSLFHLTGPPVHSYRQTICGKYLVCWLAGTRQAAVEFPESETTPAFWSTCSSSPELYGNSGHRPEPSQKETKFSSVAQSCPTLCDPMNRSTPGLPVHHHLPEFTQTHVHRVSDAIQPSHPRSSPSPPAPNPSQHQSLFQ